MWHHFFPMTKHLFFQVGPNGCTRGLIWWTQKCTIHLLAIIYYLWKEDKKEKKNSIRSLNTYGILVGLFINQYPTLGCSLALFGNQPLLGYGHAYPTRTSKDKLKGWLTSSTSVWELGCTTFLSVLTNLHSKFEPKETADWGSLHWTREGWWSNN